MQTPTLAGKRARRQRDNYLEGIERIFSERGDANTRRAVPIMAVPTGDPESPDEVVPASTVCEHGLRACLVAPTLAQASAEGSQHPHAQLSPAVSSAPTDDTTPKAVSIPQLTTATATVEQLAMTPAEAEEKCNEPCFAGGHAHRPPPTVSSETHGEQLTTATGTVEQLTMTPAEEECNEPCFCAACPGPARRPPPTVSAAAHAKQLTTATGTVEQEECNKPCYGAGRARRPPRTGSPEALRRAAHHGHRGAAHRDAGGGAHLGKLQQALLRRRARQ